MFIFDAHFIGKEDCENVIEFEIDSRMFNNSTEIMHAAIDKAMEFVEELGQFYMLELVRY